MGADQRRQLPTAFVSSPAVSLGQRVHSGNRFLPQLQFLDFCGLWFSVLCCNIRLGSQYYVYCSRITFIGFRAVSLQTCTWDFRIPNSLRS